MGMSTHVVAFRDLGGEFRKMLEIKRFCDEKKVSYPKEVTDYFGTSVRESEAYLVESMSEVCLGQVVRPWRDDSREGYEIDVKNIPSNVKTIRFYNSW